MHMAVSRGSDAIGTAGRGPEHVAEGGLALADRASVGGGTRHDGDHAAHRHLQADGVALAGTLPGGRCRWPLARQEPASGEGAAGGRADRQDYQLFLAINDIEHTNTKVKSPQTNGICERFHKTILQEFYQVTFRKKIYETIEQLQIDLDQCIDYYNNERTHQGKVCEGRTPMQTLVDGKSIWKEKFVG